MSEFIEKTHQTYEDTEELDDVCVRHRVQSSDQCVEDSNQGRKHHWDADVDVHNHAQCCSCAEDTFTQHWGIYEALGVLYVVYVHTQRWQNSSWPEDLSQ